MRKREQGQKRGKMTVRLRERGGRERVGLFNRFKKSPIKKVPRGKRCGSWRSDCLLICRGET